MTVRCDFCGKEMERSPWSVKHYKNVFCSKQCCSDFMRRGKIIECTWCGKPIYRSPSIIHPIANFCSNSCRRKWLGERDRTVINVKGHNLGHKAEHFSVLNKMRNPQEKIADNPVYVNSRLYRLIAEAKIGRKLNKGEVVHHINGVRTDNRPENLQVMTCNEHSRLHMEIAKNRLAVIMAGGGNDPAK